MRPCARKKSLSPADALARDVSALLEWKVPAHREDLAKEVPKSWEKHGDFALLPPASFRHPRWADAGDELWEVVRKHLGVRRLGRKGKISPDDFRSPMVEIISGDPSDVWVTKREAGIWYTWDVTRSMFCPGNVTEKIRLSRFDCSAEVVVDLFAGIGYFTLPFLVKARAKFVHACEWNPAAVEALRRNLDLNRIAPGRCEVHEGDCRKVCPVGVADRVNLGLIPSSEIGWVAAVRALNPVSGGVLHVHGNVDLVTPVSEFIEPGRQHPDYGRWARSVVSGLEASIRSCEELPTFRSVEPLRVTKVKSYAPKVHHLVLDVRIEP